MATGTGKTRTTIQAAIEFKLDDKGWSNGRAKSAIAELGKLALSVQDVELRYFVVLTRYTAPADARWNKYWHQVEQVSIERQEINSIYVTHWISIMRDFEVKSFGNWMSKYEEL